MTETKINDRIPKSVLYLQFVEDFVIFDYYTNFTNIIKLIPPTPNFQLLMEKRSTAVLFFMHQAAP